MRSYASTCIAAALCAAVLGVGWYKVSAAAGTISGPARIVDGDTVVVNGTHIRLLGLDAPEISNTNGPKAKAVMRDIVGDQIITCKPDDTRSYNRVIAVCSLPDGTDISRELVHRGWALDCFRYSHGRYRKDEPVGVRQKLIQAPYC